jgi:hypothetical protein
MTSTRISRAGLAVAIVLVLGLAGCGASSGSATPQVQSRVSHRAKPADTGHSPADMVAAVSAGKGGPPVDLKFELRELPEVGQPLDVDLAVLTAAPAINRVFAKFQGTDGLDLMEGGDLSAVEKPAPGVVIRHIVRVLPKQDGIFTLSATVSVDMADDSITRTYSIPVIVGNGLPEQAAKAEVAGGQPAPGTFFKTH